MAGVCRRREGEFLRLIHDTVAKGHKVLVPTFALGRAQELCLLLHTYWKRMELTVPIRFSAQLAEQVHAVLGLYPQWTNTSTTRDGRRAFDFRTLRPPSQEEVSKPGPMVLFATPGMMDGGASLNVGCVCTCGWVWNMS